MAVYVFSTCRSNFCRSQSYISATRASLKSHLRCRFGVLPQSDRLDYDRQQHLASLRCCVGGRTMSLNSLSHYLAKVLRHSADSEGITLTSDGYANVEDILKKKTAYKVEDVEKIVSQDAKKRFHLRNCSVTGKRQIRANQGHTLKVKLDLEEITDASLVKEVLHGTSLDKWDLIKLQGLSRMRRDHIHFAPGESSPEVISGIPSGCSVIISIDLRKALRDGIKFYRSANNVILSPGNREGVIPLKYIKKVYHRRTREQIYP